MNLNVKTCVLCGKMFKYKGNAICPSCLERMDKDYIVVRDYLYDHPESGIQELSEGTEVDEKIILQLVRMGRLEFAEGADTGIRCSSCGKPISSGSMCDACKNQMQQTLRSVLPKQMQQPKKKEPPTSSKAARGIRMHTADRRETED